MEKTRLYNIQELYAKIENIIYVDSQGYMRVKFEGHDIGCVFQPIARLEPDRVSLFGYEGLMRATKRGANISPPDFFKTFAGPECAFVDLFLMAIHGWNFSKYSPPGTKIFLNIDPNSYRDEETFHNGIALLFDCFSAMGVDTRAVVCEITEFPAVSDDLLKVMVRILREFDVAIAVDDYGCKASTLERVLMIEPEIVKFDREWLFKGLKSDALADLFCRSVEQIKSIGSLVLAEGVENLEAMNLCRRADVHYLQGHYLAYPAERIQAGIEWDINELFHDSMPHDGTNQRALRRASGI